MSIGYSAVYRFDVIVNENNYGKRRISFAVHEKGKARQFVEDVNKNMWPGCYSDAQLVEVIDHWEDIAEITKRAAANYERLTGKPYPKK